MEENVRSTEEKKNEGFSVAYIVNGNRFDKDEAGDYQQEEKQVKIIASTEYRTFSITDIESGTMLVASLEDVMTAIVEVMNKSK